jgi:hypothetical protein
LVRGQLATVGDCRGKFGCPGRRPVAANAVRTRDLAPGARLDKLL